MPFPLQLKLKLTTKVKLQKPSSVTTLKKPNSQLMLNLENQRTPLDYPRSHMPSSSSFHHRKSNQLLVPISITVTSEKNSLVIYKKPLDVDLWISPLTTPSMDSTLKPLDLNFWLTPTITLRMEPPLAQEQLLIIQLNPKPLKLISKTSPYQKVSLWELVSKLPIMSLNQANSTHKPMLPLTKLMTNSQSATQSPLLKEINNY